MQSHSFALSPLLEAVDKNLGTVSVATRLLAIDPCVTHSTLHLYPKPNGTACTHLRQVTRSQIVAMALL